jgi:hypothetical protein
MAKWEIFMFNLCWILVFFFSETGGFDQEFKWNETEMFFIYLISNNVFVRSKF